MARNHLFNGARFIMLIRLKDSAHPLHRRLTEALKAAIRSGRLAAGGPLPSSRQLALDLQISRNTVVAAYAQLAAEGYLHLRDRAAPNVVDKPGKSLPRRVDLLAEKPPGTAVTPQVFYPALSSYATRLAQVMDARSVASASSVSRRGIRYDFQYGRPGVDEFPREIWRKLVSTHTRRASRDSLGYGDPAGLLQLRSAISKYLARARGMAVPPQQIIVVNGSQQGIDLAARLLLDVGDTALVEEPHYPGATKVFEAQGARLLRVATDAHGLVTQLLPSAAVVKRTRLRMAYVTPCHQFPSGSILPLERRMALLDWARQHQVWLLEDDYVSEFRYEGRPIEPLQALESQHNPGRAGQVIYIGTFSKTLFPSLRLGYLVVPPALAPVFAAAKWAADRFASLLPQLALTEFIESGQFDLYLRRASLRNARKRKALLESLVEHFGDRVETAGGPSGVHLLVHFKALSAKALDAEITRAATAGVGVYSAASYYAAPQPHGILQLGYASLTESEIRTGIRKLAQVMLATAPG